MYSVGTVKENVFLFERYELIRVFKWKRVAHMIESEAVRAIRSGLFSSMTL